MKVGHQSGNTTSDLFIRVVKPHSKFCTAPRRRGGHWRIDVDKDDRVQLLQRSWSGDMRGSMYTFIPLCCNITPGCEAFILAPASHLEWAVEAVVEQNDLE
jgi:hypothetical protein